MSQAPPRTLGLALSGGGSRAAAFHRGTLQALLDLNLVDRIETISTVSGGSVFGGAWMAARVADKTDTEFLEDLRRELKRGFIFRSMRPRLVKMAIPFLHYSRTNAIADTFDKAFFHGITLSQLPSRPALCINTTIVNNGQVGKFSRFGFSAWGLNLSGAIPPHQVALPDYPLSKAVAASAAFPVGLPPLRLKKSELPKGVDFEHSLKGAHRLALTDGGVLENLGIQTLLKSSRFATWDMIISDAGTASTQWRDRKFVNTLRSVGVWAFSGRTLEQIMLIMNDKQNRWAREQVIDEINSTWLTDAARTGKASAGLPVFLNSRPALSRRQVLFVRVDQSWRRLLLSIPKYRLHELSGGTLPLPLPNDVASVEQFLTNAGIDLKPAREHYQALKGDTGVDTVNRVATNFTGLSDEILKQLALHASWQVHATHAIYGL